MNVEPQSLEALIAEFAGLPGIVFLPMNWGAWRKTI